MNRFKEVICLCAKNFLELLNSDILLDSEKKTLKTQARAFLAAIKRRFKRDLSLIK